MRSEYYVISAGRCPDEAKTTRPAGRVVDLTAWRAEHGAQLEADGEEEKTAAARPARDAGMALDYLASLAVIAAAVAAVIAFLA